MGLIGPEHKELSDLELEKSFKYEFVYTLASTNFGISAPELIKTYNDQYNLT